MQYAGSLVGSQGQDLVFTFRDGAANRVVGQLQIAEKGHGKGP